MRAALAVLVAGSLACSGGPRAPAPYDAVGHYTFATTIDGYDVTGSVTIERSAGGELRGVVTPDWGEPPMRITSVHVVDHTVTVNAAAQDGELVVVMEVLDDGTMIATWSLGDQAGSATGRKEPVG